MTNNPRAKRLPEHWQQWVANHPQLGKGTGGLTPEFNNHVFVLWEDGSHMHFQNAFLVIDTAHKEIGVFTEHCGYYSFPMSGLSDYGMLKREKAQTIGEKNGG